MKTEIKVQTWVDVDVREVLDNFIQDDRALSQGIREEERALELIKHISDIMCDYDFDRMCVAWFQKEIEEQGLKKWPIITDM